MIITVIVIIGVIVLFYPPEKNTSPAGADSNISTSNLTRPAGGYLRLQTGALSQIYLINSSISYGTFSKDISYGPDESYHVKTGDPCVIITGTIRNDGMYKYVAMAADIYNTNDEKVGTVVNGFSKPWFVTVGVDSNNTSPFTIMIKYDKRDVTGYDIYLSWEPTASAPP